MPLIEILTPRFWLWLDLALHLTLFLMVSLHCLHNRREPASTLLWIFVAWSFPVIGALLYLMFGINSMPRKVWRKQRADHRFLAQRQALENEARPMAYWRTVHESLAAAPEDPAARAINHTMDRLLPEHPLLGGNQISALLDGDEAFPLMLAALSKAQHHIHLQTFIIGHDNIGRQFLDLLAAKARAGVKVRILFDRFGSTGAVISRLFARYRRVPNLHISGWTQANALKRQFQFNLRNHRKIMVIDGQHAFFGGINLRAENTTRAGQPAIRDYHFAVRGPIVQELQYSFLSDWHFMTNENPAILLQAAYFPRTPAVGSAQARLVNGGPTTDEMENMLNIFFECLISARRQLLVVTPYFVPPSEIRRALRAAAARGVDVRLVVPRHNNHFYAGLASQALYAEMLAGGIRIFERQPPFMHAKALLMDDKLALIGSANLDMRSLRLNYETNLVVFDAPFINALKRIILADIAHSQELTLAAWQARPAGRRLLENFCHLLTPLL
ncbi:MAG: cardiolipin synthase [Lentisphaerae bacterium]|nr:cardiolipin synthase [Lentisphaerota bacterium]